MTDNGSGAASKGPAEQALAGAEALMNATRSLVGWLTRVGGAGAQAVVPDAVSEPVEHWLKTLQQFGEQMPTLGDEFGIVLRELHAKRLTIKAVTAELAVLDAQLEVLERALAPLETWNEQWGQIRRVALRSTDLSSPETPDPR